MEKKIPQQRRTFCLNLVASIFSANKVFSKFEKKYGGRVTSKNWSIFSPFKITAEIEITVSQDINVDEMRKVQHKKMIKGKPNDFQD